MSDRTNEEQDELHGRVTMHELAFLHELCLPSAPSYSTIALRLGVSIADVEGYRDRLFAEFQAGTREELVRYARKHGLAGQAH